MKNLFVLDKRVLIDILLVDPPNREINKIFFFTQFKSRELGSLSGPEKNDFFAEYFQRKAFNPLLSQGKKTKTTLLTEDLWFSIIIIYGSIKKILKG